MYRLFSKGLDPAVAEALIEDSAHRSVNCAQCPDRLGVALASGSLEGDAAPAASSEQRSLKGDRGPETVGEQARPVTPSGSRPDNSDRGFTVDHGL